MKSVFGPISVILLVSMPLFISALTTFGKTSPQNQNPPPPPTPAIYDSLNKTTLEFGRLTSMGRSGGGRAGTKAGHIGHSFGKARECRMENDCSAIQNTTCMADPRDGKTRCLCGDYSAPVNGLCTNKWKAVRAPCNDHAECGDGAHCIQGNNTSPGKKCACLEGYYEENYRCNGSSSILRNPSIIVMFFAIFVMKTVSSS